MLKIYRIKISVGKILNRRKKSSVLMNTVRSNKMLAYIVICRLKVYSNVCLYFFTLVASPLASPLEEKSGKTLPFNQICKDLFPSEIVISSSDL